MKTLTLTAIALLASVAAFVVAPGAATYLTTAVVGTFMLFLGDYGRVLAPARATVSR